MFLDFDGTITTRDVGMHLLERFAPPEWRAISRRSTTPARSAAASACSTSGTCSPPTRRALRAAAREVALDPGFAPLVAGLRGAGAEVTVVSDGFGFYVEEVVRRGRRPGADQHGRLVDRPARVPPRGPLLPVLDVRRVQAGADQGRHATAASATVLVGDGTSDRKAALLADVVFAKGALARWCAVTGVAHMPFDRLAEVHAALFP